MIQRLEFTTDSRDHRTHAPEISRDNLVRTLEDMLSGATQTIVVCGATGMGKSTLLRQFVAANEGSTIALFVSAASRWAYDPAELESRVSEQVATLLGVTEHFDATDDVALNLRRLYQQLRRRAEKTGSRIFFVLDGLEDIPLGAEATTRQIVELLPLGFSDCFRFILSATGSVADLPLSAPACSRAKELIISGFNSAEIRQYLSGFTLVEGDFTEVIRVTRGNPQQLVAIRRLMEHAADPRRVVVNLPSEAPDLFRLQWQAINIAERSHALPLAILAFEEHSRTDEDLADLMGATPDAVGNILSSLPFLTRDDSGYWQYVSESDRQFAREELRNWETAVHDAFIERLQRNPDSPATMANLPVHYVAAGKMRELVDYLDAARFARLYETAPSLAVVRRRAEEGIEAARSLNRDADVLRFTIQKTTIQEISGSATAISEVRALAAVGELDTASAVAEAASRVEDRFRLFAAVARARHDAGLAEDPGLMERLHDLFKQIDPASLGENRISVAVDLLPVAADVAVELVSSGMEGGENGMDWSLASLVISAHASHGEADTDRQTQRIRERIQDPAARRLSVAASVLFGELSASEVLSRAEALATTSDRLFVLQHWIVANRESEESLIILDRALEWALQAREYRVNASTFRRLASSLPYVGSLQEASFYVERFDALRAAIESQGPPEDFFRLQLILARTEWRWDRAAARDRFLSIYNDASKLNDPVIRTTVLARLAATIAKLDPARTLDEDLHEAVEADLSDGVEKLRIWSAEHHEVFRGLVRALAAAKPASALEVIPKVNTEWRRDELYAEFIESAADAPTDEIPVDSVLEAIERIASPRVHDNAITSFLEAVERREFTDSQLARLEPLFRTVESLRSSEARLRRAASLAGLLCSVESGSSHPLADWMLDVMRNAWAALDDGYPKLHATAEAIAALARRRPQEARSLIPQFNELKAQLTCTDAETAHAGRFGLALAIRAYAGLVRYQLLSPEHQEDRLLHAITQCGTLDDQALLLASLSIRYYFAGKHSNAAAVAERLVRILELMQDDNNRMFVSVSVWPALYLSAPGTANALLDAFGAHDRDVALYSSAWVILLRQPTGDAFDLGPRTSYDASGNDLFQVIQLMRQIDNDAMLYILLRTVVDASDPSRRSDGISRMQRGEILRMLSELAQAKFPNPRFISHNGYRIAAESHLNRLREGANARSGDNLVNEAKNIPNLSDRVLVLGIIASNVRKNHDRDKILQEAESVLEQIPMLRDRVDRFNSLANLVLRVDSDRAKNYVRKAVQLLLGGEGRTWDERRQSIIDLAYRIDPDFAAGVAAAFDDDPAKARVDAQVKRHRLAQNLTRGPDSNQVAAANALEISQAAWTQLGLLQAGQTSTVAPQSLLPLLTYAAPQPVSEAYPIFAYFLENAIRRVQYGAAEIRAYVRPLYEAVLHGAELAVHVPGSRRALPHIPEAPEVPAAVSVIRAGHREEAVDQMRRWLQTQVGHPLYIFEPYFYPDDVDLFKIVREFDPEWDIRLVAGRDALRHRKVEPPYADRYRAAWYNVSSDDPPPAFVAFVGRVSDGKCPIHDRWWLTDTGGLHLGTSFNGFGSKLSTIRVMDSPEVEVVFESLNPYFSQRRIVDGERYTYEAFTL